jgi:hypothetical protein
VYLVARKGNPGKSGPHPPVSPVMFDRFRQIRRCLLEVSRTDEGQSEGDTRSQVPRRVAEGCAEFDDRFLYLSFGEQILSVAISRGGEFRHT